MAELKTQPTKQSVKAFLDKITDTERRADCLAVAKLMEEVTGHKPVMWGANIVGFGSYHYKYDSGREADWPIIGFSPRKQNLTLYIMGGFDKHDELVQKLGKHSVGKSCLYINRLADVNMPTLTKLIKESVKYMRKRYPDSAS